MRVVSDLEYRVWRTILPLQRLGKKMVVTKADVYEKVILAERPVCPHCDRQMRIWENLDPGLSCGSGWGTPYLFVCQNNECPPFVNGWDNMKKNYGRTCSYRCIGFPDSLNTEMMMVYTRVDIDSGIIDEAVIAADKARGTAEDPAVQELIRHFESKDIDALMTTLFDEKVHYKVRMKAAALIGEAGSRETIDPLLGYQSKDQRISDALRDAINRIHAINGTRECPFCSEIVQAGVATCNECGRELD
ncbi:MAG: hypothetical protein JRJ47_12630 [Deltaproteobacteria bacterium]|nr:hypothetical protein [Deltaproteobacteria bacterium]